MPGPETGHSPGRMLARYGLAPRKRLGQSFLRDPSFLRRIVDAASLDSSDLVLEIGPGTGALTMAIARTGAQIVAVELDNHLLAALRVEMRDVPNVMLRQGNALDFDPCSELGQNYKLVANIPYYITGPLIRHFLESKCPPEDMVLMVQREVAGRITAQPGHMSLLAVSVQYYATAERLFTVPAGAFLPPPKVDSAVIRISPASRHSDPAAASHFFEVVRAGFAQRRKQLVNTLGAGLKFPRGETIGMLQAAEIDPTRRAESLSIREWERLAAAIPPDQKRAVS
ncbi:MAG TPA: 16S rRNA (adenine(1518)-N(6)/adenine(1519)-N(6))-dimethyltransferase RsmA [Chloroflexota bacterium]